MYFTEYHDIELDDRHLFSKSLMIFCSKKKESYEKRFLKQKNNSTNKKEVVRKQINNLFFIW